MPILSVVDVNQTIGPIYIHGAGRSGRAGGVTFPKSAALWDKTAFYYYF